MTPLFSVALHFEYDLVAARRRARQIAELLGFDQQDQTRIATVASEIARNALRYGNGGRFEFAIDPAERSLVMKVVDHGPGIPNLDEVMAGRYQSKTGMGLGINGARRLMDSFDIRSAPDKGTTVVMTRRLPAGASQLTRERVLHIVDDLAKQRPDNPLEEIQQQNAELLEALGELTVRKEELQRLNQELEDTNRGVLALYAQLDENAENLRRADQLKTRFLSDMSHEFRTPVNSILALSRLLDEVDLDEEHRKQLNLIRRAAADLESLTNDLLDLAKIEAGKIEVRPADFEVSNLFSALRGMLRPLLVNRAVSLVFDAPQDIPPLFNDEGKVSQILRNFISNALKFTEAGEIRVAAEIGGRGDSVVFTVTDTGIGIAPEDQERIFEEFTQLENPMQRIHKGSGLGLPLTRKLATLLGGGVGVRSELGSGSTFFAEIPIHFRAAGPQAASRKPPRSQTSQNAGLRVLIIDDDETARYAVRSFASRPGTEIIEADNGAAGLAIAHEKNPDVILLDLMMPGIGGHEVLQRLKSDPVTLSVPVIIVTSRFINDEEKRQIMTRATAVIYKRDLSREVVVEAIDRAMAR